MKLKNIFCLLLCVTTISGCANNVTKGKVGDVKERNYNTGNELQKSSTKNENSNKDLKKISDNMEKQQKQIAYDEMDQRLLEFYTQPLQDEFEFYGRFSNLGYAYIIGSCKEKQSSISKRQLGPKRSEFPEIDFNQDYIQLGNWSDKQKFSAVYSLPGVQTFFRNEDGTKIYLGIRQPETADIGLIFDRLVNEKEETYLEELYNKKMQALPPVDGPFLQIRKLIHGKAYDEYFPISNEKFSELTSDDTKVNTKEIDKTGISLYTSINTWKEGEKRLEHINKAVLNYSREQGLFQSQSLDDITDIAKIQVFQKNGKNPTKEIEDIKAIQQVVTILKKSKYTDISGCPYTNLLVFTQKDGSKIELQLASDGCDGFVLGDYACYTPGKAEWKILSKILGI